MKLIKTLKIVLTKYKPTRVAFLRRTNHPKNELRLKIFILVSTILFKVTMQSKPVANEIFKWDFLTGFLLSLFSTDLLKDKKRVCSVHNAHFIKT